MDFGWQVAQLKNLNVPGINGRKEKGHQVKEIEYAEECQGWWAHSIGGWVNLLINALLLCQKEAFDAGVPEKLPS